MQGSGRGTFKETDKQKGAWKEISRGWKYVGLKGGSESVGYAKDRLQNKAVCTSKLGLIREVWALETGMKSGNRGEAEIE